MARTGASLEDFAEIAVRNRGERARELECAFAAGHYVKGCRGLARGLPPLTAGWIAHP